MKHIFILTIIFGFHLSVNGQNKNQCRSFLQAHFKNLEPIVYTDAISTGVMKEFREAFSHDTLINNQSQPMLVLSKAEKNLIHSEIDKLNQKFVNKELLKKSHFIPNGKLDLILKDPISGWSGFNKKYGKGYYSFSKPIFIRDSSICIFFSNFTCGMLCAQGELSVYKKSGGQWVKWFTLSDFIS
ncbi:hypothetical protein D3C86_1551150 [compost metagenome]